MAAILSGLVGVMTGAAGEQFLPVLSVREGAIKAVDTPMTNGYIAYLTLLNVRDGGINGVKLIWEACETVYDIARGVECYERLKAKGATGAAVVIPSGTPLTYALTERATHDRAQSQSAPSLSVLQESWQIWTVRVGLAHRALAVEDGEDFI